jgi:hypothetical protein
MKHGNAFRLFDGERPSIYPVFALGEMNGNPDGKELSSLCRTKPYLSRDNSGTAWQARITCQMNGVIAIENSKWNAHSCHVEELNASCPEAPR